MADRDLVEQRLKENIAWYVDNFKIRDEHGRIVPFVLNKIQIDLEREAIVAEIEGRPAYFLVLKARQEGVSTWAEAYLFRMALQYANTRVLVTAHKEDASRNVFGMAKRYYEYLPEKPGTKRSATNALHLKSNDSEFIVQTAGSGSGAGRSYTFSGWHGSEIDLWPEANDLFVAVMQAVPKVAGTIRILESTSEGPGYLMHELWGKAAQGRGDFKAFFFPWFDHPKYSKPLSWEGLISYGPSDWVTRFKDRLKAMKEAQDAIRIRGECDAERGPGTEGGVAGQDGTGSGAEREEEGPAGESQNGSGAESRGYGRDSGSPRGRDGGEGDRTDGSGSRGAPPESDRSHTLGQGGGAPGAGTIRDRGHLSTCPDEDLRDYFRDSLTDYELGLITEFDLTYEQINALRFLFESECNGDIDKRKREYPSRPEEAFEASGGDVLDQKVLADWWEFSEKHPEVARVNMVPEYDALGRPLVKWQEDKHGKIQIFEWPEDAEKYVMFVDCAEGTSTGDWTVGFVTNVRTGDQVAEYRAKEDPDMGSDQIELLAMLYNGAYTGVEVNGGYGWPYVSHLSQRAHLNGMRLYERVAYDRQGAVKVKVKRPGWNTDTKTRPLLVAASKEAVRKRQCKIRSQATIEECQTLHANRMKGGKVEARPGKHDDGWIAYSGAVVLRNEELANLNEIQEEAPKKKYPLFEFVHRNTEARKMADANPFQDMHLTEVVPATAIMPESTDERRSYL